MFNRPPHKEINMLIAPWNASSPSAFISDDQPLQKLAWSRHFYTFNPTTDGSQPKGKLRIYK